MPELTNNFIKGRMNKDFDERLIPNGEYRDALNIEISTSEGSNVGSVQNLKGNTKIDYEFNEELSDNAICVGSHSDESTKTIFSFIHKASDLVAEKITAPDGTQYTRHVGVRSDIIAKYTSSGAETGILKPLIVDVYESRHAASAQTSSNTFSGLNTYSTSNGFYIPEGIRVGMKVDIVYPDGTSVYGDVDVRVKSLNISSVSSSDAYIETTPTPAMYTSALKNVGAVVQFTDDRILNFKKGVDEIESNVTGTPTSNTPINSLITAVNYVDGILFYTDGRNEPKRIVLKHFEENWTRISIKEHSTLIWVTDAGVPVISLLKEEHITTIRKNPRLAPKVELKSSKRTVENIGTLGVQYSESTISTIGDPSQTTTAGFRLINYNPSTGEYSNMSPGDTLTFRATNTFVNWRVGDTIAITGNINAASARLKITNAYISTLSDVGLFDAQILDIDQEYIDILGQDQTTLLDQEVPASEPWLAVLVEKEAIYPEDFIYFAYRYQYVDGEFSAISPYSTPAFLPGFYSYNAKDSFNKGMDNKLQQVIVKDFIESGIPDDVEAVEILFKKSGSENIYVIEKVVRDITWALNPYENKGSYTISDSVFGRTLSSDQAIRVFDAVPVKAKAQEISSSRLLYGNYELGYDLRDSGNDLINPEVQSNIVNTNINVNTLFPIVNAVEASWYSSDTLDEWHAATYTHEDIYSFGLNGTYADGYTAVSLPTTGGIFGKFRAPLRFENEVDFNNNFATTDGYGLQNLSNNSTDEARFTAPTNGNYNISCTINNPRIFFELFHESGSYYSQQAIDQGMPGPVRVVTKPTITIAVQIKKRLFGANNDFGGVLASDPSLLAEQTYTIKLDTNDTSTSVGFLPDEDYPPQGTYGGATTYPYASQSMDGGRHKWNINVPINGTFNNNSLTAVYNGPLNAGDEIQCFYEIRIDDIESVAGDATNTLWYTNPSNLAEYNVSITLPWFASGGNLGSSTLSIQAPDTLVEVLESRPKPSIKTLKSYQLGVVYGDYYGRESNVLFNSEDKMYCDISQSKTSNKLAAKIKSKAPNWAEYYKLYVKEIAKEYYNLVMYKAYPNNDTFTAGQFIEEETVYAWVAFNSNDRNKVQKDDYLVLKKRHAENEAVQEPNARYRVIDIVDNAEASDSSPGDFFINGIQIDATSSDVNGKFFVKIYADEFFNEYIGTAGVENSDNAIVNAAVFEVEKKSVIDLDLFYECSQAYPIKLTKSSMPHFIKPGMKVEIVPVGFTPPTSNHNAFNDLEFKVTSVYGAKAFPALPNSSDWDATTPDAWVAGFQMEDSSSNTMYQALNNSTILPPTYYMKFTEDDGSFVTAQVVNVVDFMTSTVHVRLVPYTHAYEAYLGSNGGSEVCSPWFNCYSFGNGVESDRIRDDFNSDPIWLYTASGKQSGFKANLPLVEKTKEEFPNNIIFSQIYNESSNTSRYNEFIIGDNITKKLNSEYGSIQKLYTRDGDVLAFCENKVLKILANKDALFNADGNAQLLSSTNVLGQAIPFTGDYGISTNPESFAVEEYRIYFTDKARGAVCRLSRDGVTPISDAGMRDWFNDNLETTSIAIGSYDGKKDEYNLTLHSSTNPGWKKNVYTLSFSENVKGWVSFKSFILESGLSLSNEYYTFKNGSMYLHHPDLTSVDRNNFYGTQNNSTITPIFNVESNTVKVFNTVAYSGTQSKEL
jgi:hypothetical protein